MLGNVATKSASLLAARPKCLDWYRSKTFTAGGESGMADAQGSTAGAPVQAGHLHSVVGLVWRSVVLWMLLVALLTLANVLG